MKIPRLTAGFKPIADVIYNAMNGQAFEAALAMGLFDHLGRTPVPSADLAGRLKAEPKALEAMLDLLAAMGLVQRRADGYVNQPAAEQFLKTSSPACQKDYVDLNLGHIKSSMRDIVSDIRAGAKPAGLNNEDWADPGMLKKVGQASLQGSIQDAVEFISSLPGFDRFDKGGDLAGNHGYYLMALLDLNPGLKGVLFDQKGVAEASQELARSLGYAERMTFRAIDLRQSRDLGQDFDFVLASHIFYYWADDLDGLLSGIARALKPGGYFISNHMHLSDERPLSSSLAAIRFSMSLNRFPGGLLNDHGLEQALERCGFEIHSRRFSADTLYTLYGARKKN